MLRNAFDGLATESTLRRLLVNLHFARDASDQLRVVVSSGATDISAVRWGSNNSYPTWYSTGAGSSMDQREMMKAQARANMQQVRATRWVIS